MEQIAQALTPFLGETAGRVLFALGITGSALVATIVVTLTAARTLGEVLGVKLASSWADPPLLSPHPLRSPDVIETWAAL